MKKIGPNIEYVLAQITGDDEQMRINLRAHQVRDRYKAVIEVVYRQTAQLFLDHTNNVYIMNKNGARTLIVYVDESIYAAELNAQRELIKLKLLELFGEEVAQFEIYVSRGAYKKHHPFANQQDEGAVEYRAVPLNEDEQDFVKQTAKTVQGPSLKNSFEKAMTASLELNKAEKGKFS